MKIKLCLFLILLFCSQLNAQGYRPVYVSHWTYLYAKGDLQSSKVGVLATEAAVKLLDSTEQFYKVAADNGDVGFIAKQKLKTGMFGKKDADEPAQYFYRGEQGSQCPHFYVQVSGLRSRSEPSTSGKVLSILPINSMQCVEYVPLNKEGWVYIGDHFHERPAYIQKKFLGKQISFEEVLAEFKNIKDAAQQKVLLERLVELGWNSKPENTLKALTLLKSFHQSQNTLASVPTIDFDLFLAQSIQYRISSEERVNYDYGKIYFVINNKKFEEGNLSEKQLREAGLKKVDDYSKLPIFSECGWDPVYSYTNASQKTIINFEKYEQKIVSSIETLNLLEDSSITIEQFLIDKSTSEVDFIKKFGKVLWFDRFNSPGVYYLPEGDAGFLMISFANGKATSFHRSYYC